MLVWILQRLEMPPQDAEQFCNALNPKIIEGALNVLARALLNAVCGAVEGLPVVAARVLCGHRREDLTTLFPLPPSPTPGVADVLMHEIRQFVVRSDVEYNPAWAKRAWPRANEETAPTPAQPTESAVAESLPGSKVGSEKPQPPNKPDSVNASVPANVGYVDPGVADALAHAVKRARPAHTVDEIVAEIVKSLSDLLARSGEAKAPGSDPAARAEEEIPAPTPAVESEPVPPAESPRVEPGRDVGAADVPVQGTQVKSGGPQFPATGGPESSQTLQAQQPPPQQWDPRADWSVETVFQELRIKGPVQEVIVRALPKVYSDNIAGELDRLVAKKPWQTTKLRQAIWDLLGKEAGRTLRDKEIPSWDACKDFLMAWYQWRAHHSFKI
jgi:hypothetical protein